MAMRYAVYNCMVAVYIEVVTGAIGRSYPQLSSSDRHTLNLSTITLSSRVISYPVLQWLHRPAVPLRNPTAQA